MILAIFTFNIINVNAYEIDDFVVTDYGTDSTYTYNSSDNVITSNTNDTNDYKYHVNNPGSFLYPDINAEKFEEIKPLTKYGHTAFITTANNTSSVEYFADSYYHSHFGTQSGTIFIIDMSNREIYIFSDGANYRTVTKSKAYSITDNTYRDATNKEYYRCASRTFKQINTILDGGKIAEPMRYTSNIFIAITLAFFFSFLYILGKSRIKKASDSAIVKNCDIDFKIGETSAIKTGQHRVYSPQSSGGSGGGGGGGGGGSGGGGGHSF